MRHHLNFRASFKRLAIFAITASCISFVPSAKAQAPPPPPPPGDWIITVDATGSNASPEYRVNPQPVKPSELPCTFAQTTPPSTAGNLYVCPGDTIQWKASTTDPGTGQKSQMYLYHEQAILDQGGASPHGFQAQNGAPVKATIKTDAGLDGPHEYYVAVFDNVTNHLYVDDPKIIIGTGTNIQQVNKVLNVAREKVLHLRALVNRDPAATEPDKEGAEKLVKDIEALQNSLDSRDESKQNHRNRN